ncbi:Major facilitator superfamily [Macrophomina phaseolina MS6]|uniref:Major facilitator superfamily n=1 Tax=Macrophomina phaseolina (strain MS6) TaxID=1126212 RepID=K2RNJ2_MACPH|nr:Major facilitator superfamily [Macrophomina phaseolina MS6]
MTLYAHEGPSPITWPLSWRIIILINVSFYNMMGNVFAAGISPLIGPVVQDLHCTQTEASRLPGYALLMLGVANLYALPATEYIGKRNTINFSMLIFLACNIWAAKAQSYESLVGSRFVGGFFGGVVEALGPSIVAECFPGQQLGRAMVIYVGFLAGGSALGPIAAGAIATHLSSWRWFFNISAIAIGLNLVTSLLMLPETTYTLPGRPASPPAADVELRAVGVKTPSSGNSRAPSPTPDGGPFSTPPPPRARTWRTRSLFVVVDNGRARRSIPAIVREQLYLLAAPPVLLTTLLFGLTIGWTVLCSVVLAAVYSAPPHLFDAQAVGFFNWGPLVGLMVGIPVGGALADVLSTRARKRRGPSAAHDPRDRLPALLVGSLVSPAGWLLMGFALRDGLQWGVVSVGWGMSAFGLTASANVLLTYSVDCFPERAGHIGVLVNFMKNAIAFGVSYGSLSWYAASGPVGQFGAMAGAIWAVYLFVPVVYFWSDELRAFSRKLY